MSAANKTLAWIDEHVRKVESSDRTGAIVTYSFNYSLRKACGGTISEAVQQAMWECEAYEKGCEENDE